MKPTLRKNGLISMTVKFELSLDDVVEIFLLKNRLENNVIAIAQEMSKIDLLKVVKVQLKLHADDFGYCPEKDFHPSTIQKVSAIIGKKLGFE